MELLIRAHSSLAFGLLREPGFVERFGAALRQLGLRGIEQRLDEVPSSIMAEPIPGQPTDASIATTCRPTSDSTPTAGRSRRLRATTEPRPRPAPSAGRTASGWIRVPAGHRREPPAAAPGRSRPAAPSLTVRRPRPAFRRPGCRPPPMTTTRSNSVATNSMSWLMAMTVRPASARRAGHGARAPRRPRPARWSARRAPAPGPHGQHRGQRQQLPPRGAQVVGIGPRRVGRARRGHGAVDRRSQLVAAQPDVARPELDLGPDAAGEDLAIGVLEDQSRRRGPAARPCDAPHPAHRPAPDPRSAAAGRSGGAPGSSCRCRSGRPGPPSPPDRWSGSRRPAHAHRPAGRRGRRLPRGAPARVGGHASTACRSRIAERSAARPLRRRAAAGRRRARPPPALPGRGSASTSAAGPPSRRAPGRRRRRAWQIAASRSVFCSAIRMRGAVTRQAGKRIGHQAACRQGRAARSARRAPGARAAWRADRRWRPAAAARRTAARDRARRAHRCAAPPAPRHVRR